MECFDALLKSWLAGTSPTMKDSLKRYGFGAFLSIRQYRVEEGLLDACLDYWDPEFYVFRFRGGEVCPLPEEFSVIGGWTLEAYPVVVPNAASCHSRFYNFLSLGDREMNDLLAGGLR